MKNKKIKSVIEYLFITMGTLLIALGLHMFLAPNTIAPGGVSGLAIVIKAFTGIEIYVTNIVVNIPLFIMGVAILGRAFGAKTGYGTIALTVWLAGLSMYFPEFIATEDVLLAAIFGGIITGAGIGLVFRNHATTGGTDLAGAILHKYFPNISTAKLMMVIDLGVVVSAGIVAKNVETSLYSLIALYTIVKIADFIVEGLDYSKQFYIVTDNSEKISEEIFKSLGRGVTALQGRGMYTGKDKDVLLCVVNRAQVAQLKDIVIEIDPKAFIMLTTVHEVLGEGFREIAN